MHFFLSFNSFLALINVDIHVGLSKTPSSEIWTNTALAEMEPYSKRVVIINTVILAAVLYSYDASYCFFLFCSFFFFVADDSRNAMKLETKKTTVL